MPIYDFKCEACNKTVEVRMKISEPAPEVCQSCGEAKLKKQIASGTSYILKGSGWYETDSKKPSVSN